MWRHLGLGQCSLAVLTALALPKGPQLDEQQSPLHLKAEVPNPPPCAQHEIADPFTGPLASLDDDALLGFHRALVRIDSTSGYEHEIGVFLEEQLRFLDYTVERQNVSALDPSMNPVPAQRFNLFAFPASHRKTPLLLTTHMDTVPPYIPWSMNPTTGQIAGRGTVDAKACIATQLIAAQSLIRSGAIDAQDIAHLFVVGEEVNGDGMLTANELRIPWETVIFGEPTEGRLASGHKGLLMLTLRAHGRAAHSGYPWLGRSATATLVKALAALQTMTLPWSEKYGNTTLNIGTIQGGVAANVLAENATADIGIRLADGNVAHVQDLLRETVACATGADDDAHIELDFTLGDAAYGPVDSDCDVPGFGECVTVNYGTDIPHLKGRHRRYLYGPGSIFVAHGKDEALFKDDLLRAVEGYKRLILHALGK